MINPNSINNPWDTLASYWDKEVSAASTVPVPNAAILMASGLMLISIGTAFNRKKSAGVLRA